MKAKKENKVYDVNETTKIRYLAEGFDIYDDNGRILEMSDKKTISYEEYEKVLNEIKKLKDSTKENELASDNKKLKKENKELTEKLEEANKTIQELTEKISAKDSNEKEGK